MNRITGILASMVLAAGVCAPAISQGITLEQVIREVCTNSDSVKMMRESTKKTSAMITEKWAAALPTVSASINASRMYQLGAGARQDQSGSGFQFPKTGPVDWSQIGPIFDQFGKLTAPMELPYYTSAITVSQPLYTFGKIGTAVMVANQIDSSVRFSYTRNCQQLQLQALDAFYQVVLTDLALSVSLRSLARKKELSEFLARNFSLGSGNKAYLLTSQADLHGQDAEVISVSQNARNTKLRLSMMMGKPLSDSLRLDTTAVLAGLAFALPASESEAVKTALENRNDLKSLGFLVSANNGGAKIFNAMYLPSIGLQASLGTAGSEAKDLVDWERRNWTVGVGMQWTLFDGLANHARARQYLSDADKLKLTRETVGKMVEIEVKSALSECAAADNNRTASGQMLASAREAYDLSNENFRQGSGQFSDLQLAEERLCQAEMGFANARYRQVRSRAALRVAMGFSIITLEDK
ncbi:MAG: TolC family protein [Fibrobacterota bacterium]